MTVAPAPGLGLIFVLQGALGCLLVQFLRRAGRTADEAFTRRSAAQREATALAATRADEREQLRRLHDTVLTTLTMVGVGAVDSRSTSLRPRAASDLRVLDGMRASPDGVEVVASLVECLAPLAGEAGGRLNVRMDVPDVRLPSRAAEAIAFSVAEALQNVARHAEVDTAVVRGCGEDQHVVVEIVDQGRGFEADAVPAARRGLRESIIGRMAAVGGSAEVFSTPGAGTRVVLRWPNA